MEQRRSESSARTEEHIGFGGVVKKYLVVRFFDEDKHPFMITVARARLIVKHQEELKTFVEMYGSDKMTLGKTLGQ